MSFSPLLDPGIVSEFRKVLTPEELAILGITEQTPTLPPPPPEFLSPPPQKLYAPLPGEDIKLGDLIPGTDTVYEGPSTTPLVPPPPPPRITAPPTVAPQTFVPPPPTGIQEQISTDPAPFLPPPPPPPPSIEGYVPEPAIGSVGSPPFFGRGAPQGFSVPGPRSVEGFRPIAPAWFRGLLRSPYARFAQRLLGPNAGVLGARFLQPDLLPPDELRRRRELSAASAPPPFLAPPAGP